MQAAREMLIPAGFVALPLFTNNRKTTDLGQPHYARFIHRCLIETTHFNV